MNFKHFCKVLFSGFLIRIKTGPLRGKKWIATSGGKFIMGTQEVYKTEAFVNSYKKGEIFFDIGAHVGYFSAIAAVLNEGSGEIYAFEPRPMNARFFRKHMQVNNFHNVTLFEVAVGETDGEVSFDTGHGSATGCVSDTGKLKVKQASVDKMIKEGILPVPGYIKIDVEGGEINVLKDLQNIIHSSRPKLLVATHNPECHKFVLDFLSKNRYSFTILNPDSIKGDTEIIALP
jgi:FkbM family methyltransferase